MPPVSISASIFCSAMSRRAFSTRPFRSSRVIGFAVPKMEQVLFAGAPAGNALLADGKTAPLPQFKGMAFYRPSALPGAQSLKFGKAPSRALMSGKTK